jgi:hypothetical protein
VAACLLYDGLRIGQLGGQGMDVYENEGRLLAKLSWLRLPVAVAVLLLRLCCCNLPCKLLLVSSAACCCLRLQFEVSQRVRYGQV